MSAPELPPLPQSLIDDLHELANSSGNHVLARTGLWNLVLAGIRNYAALSQRPAGAEPGPIDMLAELKARLPVAWAGGIGEKYRVVWGSQRPDSDRWIPLYASPSSAPAGWLPMETAPKDGTRIIARCEHENAKYCAAAGKDPVAEGWIAAVAAYWIDHNGGGWTWHGLCGKFTGWAPLPPLDAAIDKQECAIGSPIDRPPLHQESEGVFYPGDKQESPAG